MYKFSRRTKMSNDSNFDGDENIIRLTAAYNDAKAALEATPLFAARQEAGAALQAEHLRLKAEQSAARQAARMAPAPQAVPVVSDAEFIDVTKLNDTESGQFRVVSETPQGSALNIEGIGSL
jgi:hypothetical protein